MRKVLVHAGMSPLERPDIDRIFKEKLFTTNSGNLIFQYPVYRALMTEGTEFVSHLLQRNDVTDEFIEQVNAEFDCVVLPMANNFRNGISLVTGMTKFVKKLKIPCVVIGVGLQADDISQIGKGFPFDAAVKEFVSAVLDRSAMLGLRGEITGDYLASLGFKAEQHFTVTGCPSMYSRGARLPALRTGARPARDRAERPSDMGVLRRMRLRRRPTRTRPSPRGEHSHRSGEAFRGKGETLREGRHTQAIQGCGYRR